MYCGHGIDRVGKTVLSHQLMGNVDKARERAYPTTETKVSQVVEARMMNKVLQ